jgi:hypothetical protein
LAEKAHITAGVPVNGPLNPTTGSVGSCPGQYYSKVTYLTSTGSQWFTPPSGANCLKVNIPLANRGYRVGVEIVQSGTMNRQCDYEKTTRTMDFNLNFGNQFDPSKKYCITVFIVSSPPPASGTSIPANLIWN